MSLQKILDVATKHGYLLPISRMNLDTFKVGPMGALLQNNMKREWFFSMVLNRNCSVFFNENTFKQTFDFGKEMNSSYAPFGVAEHLSEPENVYKDVDLKIRSNSDFRAIMPYNRELLVCTTFLLPMESTKYFHQFQRQRRFWWRKLSPNPGRYHLTEIKQNKSAQNVDIYAQYDWGEQLIESINLFTNDHPSLSIEDLQLKDGRKRTRAHYLTSHVSLPTLFLNTICDAYDEPKVLESFRPLLRFHRKLAPYQMSFAIRATADTNKLKELALFLCLKLRSVHISTLLLPDCHKNSFEAQFAHYDQLGVPYTVLLKDSTLQNGIIGLRSRETTLMEQVHISDLNDYAEKIFKNY